MQFLWYIVIIWNIVVFLIYGLDKAKAKLNRFRVSEFFLILSAFLMGGVGAIIAMVTFHHKVSKPKFRCLIPIALIVSVIGLIFLTQGFGFKVS